jgi:hypothetical protein
LKKVIELATESKARWLSFARGPVDRPLAVHHHKVSMRLLQSPETLRPFQQSPKPIRRAEKEGMNSVGRLEDDAFTECSAET